MDGCENQYLTLVRVDLKGKFKSTFTFLGVKRSWMDFFDFIGITTKTGGVQ